MLGRFKKADFQRRPTPSSLARMSVGALTASRASPRCRTCRRPMKGHPKPTCAEKQRWENLGLIPHPPATFTNDDPIGSTSKEETTPLQLPSISVLLKRSAKVTRSRKSKSIFYSGLRQPATLDRPSARQQSSNKSPPTIEELTAFLLGVGYPVDPVEARFALSLLGERVKVPSVLDASCESVSDGSEGGATVCALLQHHIRQSAQQAPTRGSTAGVSWRISVFSHLLVAFIASAFTVFLLGTEFMVCPMFYLIHPIIDVSA